MAYDVKITKPLQVYINDKFIARVDGFEFENNGKISSSVEPYEENGPVLRLFKSDKPHIHERHQIERDKKEKAYSEWYQQITNQVLNKDYLDWKNDDK